MALMLYDPDHLARLEAAHAARRDLRRQTRALARHRRAWVGLHAARRELRLHDRRGSVGPEAEEAWVEARAWYLAACRTAGCTPESRLVTHPLPAVVVRPRGAR